MCQKCSHLFQRVASFLLCRRRKNGYGYSFNKVLISFREWLHSYILDLLSGVFERLGVLISFRECLHSYMFTKYLCGVVTKTPPDIAQTTGGFLTPWNGLSTSQSTHQRHVPGLTVPLATARLVPYDVPAPQDTKVTRRRPWAAQGVLPPSQYPCVYVDS